MVLVAAVATPAAATEWFISPTGSPSGAGTINDPWDIYALDGRDANGVIGGAVQPGDTVWLRGGTYMDPNRRFDHQGYDIALAGSLGNRVTVRNYNGERAIVDPGLTTYPGTAYLDIWGLEFSVAENMLPGATRRSYYTQGGYETPGFYDPNGNPTFLIPHGGIGLEGGSNIRLINNYIHHMTKNSLWLHPEVTGEVEVYGNIIRDGGFIGMRPAEEDGNPNGHYGTAIYGGNIGSDTWTISDNLIEDNFESPLTLRGYRVYPDPNDLENNYAAPCSNVTIEGNTLKPRYIVPDPERNANGGHLGGGDGATNMVFSQNVHYGSRMLFGFWTEVPDPPVTTHDNTFTDNYMIHSEFFLYDRYQEKDPNTTNLAIHTNLDTSGNVEWYDRNWDPQGSTDPNVNPYSPGPWTDPAIVQLRPNAYEADRANLTIVQPAGSAANIDVDFSSWLANYHRFELKDPADLWGTAVFTGTYAGSDVAVPVGGDEYSAFIAFDLGLLGDFDEDGSVTATDVNMLWPRFGNNVPPEDAMYDLTGDNAVSFADAQMLVEVIVGTSMADTNLDMEVGIMDLGNLADKYGQSGIFSDCDTNGDGTIDIMDLGNLADDYGKSYAPPVPEPASLALLALGGLAVIRRKR